MVVVLRRLKACLDLVLGILESPVASLGLAADAVHLLGCEALGLSCWVVSQTVDLTYLGIRDRSRHLSVWSLVDCNDDSTTKSKVVLQAVASAGLHTLVGPATEVPDEFCTLSQSSSTERVSEGNSAWEGQYARECPRAPPQGFTFSNGSPMLLIEYTACDANASLIS